MLKLFRLRPRSNRFSVAFGEKMVAIKAPKCTEMNSACYQEWGPMFSSKLFVNRSQLFNEINDSFRNFGTWSRTLYLVSL